MSADQRATRPWSNGRPRRLDGTYGSDDRGIDPARVTRASAGEAMELTVPERRATVVRLHKAGLSAKQIAIRLGCSRRTVQRHLAAARGSA